MNALFNQTKSSSNEQLSGRNPASAANRAFMGAASSVKGASNALFNLQAVSKQFKGSQALSNINLKIKKGEILFVTGRSGAGKSTLLNLLSGDLEPCGGKIQRPAEGTFVGQVFQDLKLFQNRTLEQNLWYAYDSSIYKNRNEFQKDLLELSSVLGARDSLNKKIKDVNGGMKQKASMLRALLSKPQVLLADEPTASLDKESSSKLFDLLNFYNVRKGLTIVWATHNKDLIKQFPGEIAHLDSGKLVYSGKACFI